MSECLHGTDASERETVRPKGLLLLPLLFLPLQILCPRCKHYNSYWFRTHCKLLVPNLDVRRCVFENELSNVHTTSYTWVRKKRTPSEANVGHTYLTGKQF